MPSGLTERDQSLANMFQRLPGHALAAINNLRPSNFASLEIPRWAPRDVIANPTSNRGDVFSHWKTYTLPHEATLRDALAAIERANAATPRARKFQLNFTNGAHMVLARDDPDDKTTLVFATVYNPGAVYQSSTARSVQRGRQSNEPQLKPLAGPNGHLLKRRADSESSFSPRKLFHHAPRPSTGHDGFSRGFTPMSAVSHQLRPNAIIQGVRPGLRETSPQAAYYRPRPVSAAYVSKALASPERGASVQTSIYPDEQIDGRFRKIPGLPMRPATANSASRGGAAGGVSPLPAAQ